MKPLLKNVDYEPQDLVGEVVKITNKHMKFMDKAFSQPHHKFLDMKTNGIKGIKGYCYGDDLPYAIKVGTKWLILKVRGSNDNEVLIANFTEPFYNFWIPLDELERSARLLG